MHDIHVESFIVMHWLLKYSLQRITDVNES